MSKSGMRLRRRAMRGRVVFGLFVACLVSCLGVVGTAEAGLRTKAFDVPGPAAQIVTGPDGNLWYTSARYNYGNGGGAPGDWDIDPLRRFTPAAKKVMTFAETGHAYDVTTGSDGNLWFTDPFADKIGRISTDGDLALFDVPGDGQAPCHFTDLLNQQPCPSTEPSEITAGPDGAMWFIEAAGERVARITTSGTVTAEYDFADDATASALTAGPGGLLWITERRGIETLSPSGDRVYRYGPAYATSITNGPNYGLPSEPVPTVGVTGGVGTYILNQNGAVVRGESFGGESIVRGLGGGAWVSQGFCCVGANETAPNLFGFGARTTHSLLVGARDGTQPFYSHPGANTITRRGTALWLTGSGSGFGQIWRITRSPKQSQARPHTLSR